MKNAQEWAKEQSAVWEETGKLAGYVELHVDGFIELIKQIQLDAYRQAITDATAITNKGIAPSLTFKLLQDEILKLYNIKLKDT